MTTSQLRFNGSIWVNLDITLRHLDQVIGRVIAPTRLSIIEWYIMRALFEADGQHASELARKVGRAATSFTPNLDRLQTKGLVERRPDPSDRRAVHIHLTSRGEQYREDVMRMAEKIDTALGEKFSSREIETFLKVIAELQSIDSLDNA